MIKEMICIACPMGCPLTVRQSQAGYEVTGNLCPRGKVYGIQEMTDPRRMVTSTVRVSGGDHAMVSVKSSRPIPKAEVFRFMAVLKNFWAEAPIQAGDVLMKDVLQLGADLIATRSVAVDPSAPDQVAPDQAASDQAAPDQAVPDREDKENP